MAGDWIAIRCDLANEPEVIAIAGATGLDEFAVVGRLHRLWSWANRHTTDGNAPGVTYSWIDRYLQHTGFAEAMESAGWLANDGAAVSIPKFDRFNSQSGKQRLLTAKRVAEHKRSGNARGNANGNGASVTDALPKEQKRTEENTSPSKAPPPAAKGGDSRRSQAWKGVEEDLLKCGVSAAGAAVDAAMANNCRPDDVTATIAFWRCSRGKWQAGALYQRILNLRPGQDHSELWPDPSKEFQATEARAASVKSHATLATERLAGEKRRQNDREAREERERRYGAALDALTRDQVLSIIKEHYADSSALMIRRMPAAGKMTGAVRDELLIHLDQMAGVTR